ncbi:MAG: hypothetical protein LBQ83_02345 [Candidatus Margulisbacteria bacterium]|jgi:hypothetical protein|nr:hypothetical protein [Candidatus Margulisiibacteriota bacterium]
MLKKSLIMLLLAGLLWSMGEKPESAGAPGGAGAGAPPRPVQTPLEDLSVDQLYRRALREHYAAQELSYPEQTDKAIKALELFLRKFPADARRFDVMYYITLDYAKNNRLEEQKKVIDEFFATAPTENRQLYNAMRLEQLPALVWAGETAAAQELYTALQEQYSTDNAVLARTHQDILPVLESRGDIAGQKAIYRFFRTDNNRNYLRNGNNYYIYTYKLALLSYNEKNFKEAVPLFQEVAARRSDPTLALFAESSENYLQQISGAQ